jgi:hypothetical protein
MIVADDGQSAHFDRLNCQDLSSPVAVDLGRIRFVGPEGNILMYDGAIFDEQVKAGTQKTTALACSSPNAGVDIAVWLTLDGPLQFHGEVSRKPPPGQSTEDNRTGAQAMTVRREGQVAYFETSAIMSDVAGFQKVTLQLSDMSYFLEYNMKATGYVQTTSASDCMVAGFTQMVSTMSSHSVTTAGAHSFTIPEYKTMTVRVWGAGGGGGGLANGGDGGDSSFGALIGRGGLGGQAGYPGIGGATSGPGDSLRQGYPGTQIMGGTAYSGGAGGETAILPDLQGKPGGKPGGGGGATFYSPLTGDPAALKAYGGGAGGYVQKSFAAGDLVPGTPVSITVGDGGVGGTTNVDALATGGKGGHGRVLIEWQK